jgi:hypothetical protein
MTLRIGKHRNFGFLHVYSYFSKLDNLQYKKIRTSAMRNLSIIHDYSDYGKDSSQKNY